MRSELGFVTSASSAHYKHTALWTKCGRQDNAIPIAYRILKAINNVNKMSVMNGQYLREAKEENHFSGDLAPEDRAHHVRSVLQAASGLVIT